MTFLKGKWLQLWQYGPPTQAETNLADVIALARAFGCAGIAPKALDGLNWMGRIPGQQAYPDALRGVNQAAEQREACAAAGLGYAVWVNPLWGERPFLIAEGELYAAVGRAAGMIWFDTEPYEQFWGADRPESDALRIMDVFRSQAPDVPAVWQPDPRRARLAELGLTWGHHMNVFSGQDYWTDFGRPAGAQLATTFDVFHEWITAGALYADAEWAPTLPGNASPEELSAAFPVLREQGAKGCIIWRVGSTGPAQLAAIRDGELAREAGPTPPPPPQNDPTRAELMGIIEDLDEEASDHRRRLDALSHRLMSLKDRLPA